MLNDDKFTKCHFNSQKGWRYKIGFLKETVHKFSKPINH